MLLPRQQKNAKQITGTILKTERNGSVVLFTLKIAIIDRARTAVSQYLEVIMKIEAKIAEKNCAPNIIEKKPTIATMANITQDAVPRVNER